MMQPPRQAELDTPPQEGNCRLHRRGISGTVLFQQLQIGSSTYATTLLQQLYSVLNFATVFRRGGGIGRRAGFRCQ